MMLTYRVFAALLAYPEPELIDALGEAVEIVAREGLVSPAQRAAVGELAESLCAGDLIAAQERYVALFDRGRSVSLHLYEHVHGESRERGQAMVRLAQLYRLHGLEIAARELPDYLPLYLEFLSLLPAVVARRFLAEALPIIIALGRRLREEKSPYAALFEALATIAGESPDTSVELPNDAEDNEALDRDWREQEVPFMGGTTAGAEGCPVARAASQAPRS